jgi:hypothetical protein
MRLPLIRSFLTDEAPEDASARSQRANKKRGTRRESLCLSFFLLLSLSNGNRSARERERERERERIKFVPSPRRLSARARARFFHPARRSLAGPLIIGTKVKRGERKRERERERVPFITRLGTSSLKGARLNEGRKEKTRRLKIHRETKVYRKYANKWGKREREKWEMRKRQRERERGRETAGYRSRAPRRTAPS